MRTFSALVGVLCLVIVATLPFLGGNPQLRGLLWGGSFFSIFTSLWIYYALRDVRRYDQKLINVTALLSVLIAYSGVLYLGVNSPAALVILPGIYFVARSQGKLAAYSMYIVSATMQALLAGLILSDTIKDPGLITAADSEFHVRVITQGLVQLMYLGTFWLARSSRYFTLAAMDKAVASEAKAQQQEAAFIEVREDLDRALAAGGGVGHYSDQVLGGFKLGGVIGRGAMGEVYEAVNVGTGQLAAAKLLHPHVLAKQSSVERFFREAQAASAMRSEHAVQILGASQPGEPVPYLIMERLHGHDLAHHLRELGRLPIGDLVTLVHQVGSVIDMASAQGIVHRDIKPQNLFLAESKQGARWKVLDFGASKLAEHSGTLTQGRVIGTPSYMSPQQAKGQDVDGAADRYCLAAIVYRALTGRPPFAGKDLPTTLFNVVYGTPPQPSVITEVDPAVDLVLAVGMAKAPAQRFSTARDFAQALESASQGLIAKSLKHQAQALLRENPWGMLPDQDSN
jgi:serine/threonine-protein kinase